MSDVLIMENQRLVYFVARRFRGLDRDEAVSAGMLGLVEAARRYDPSKGAFSTYAVQWIRMRILEVAKTSKIVNPSKSKDGRRIMSRLHKIRTVMETQGGTVTPEALAEKIGVPVDAVRAICPLLDAQSLNVEDLTVEDRSESTEDALERKQRVHAFQLIVEAYRSRCSDLERLVLDCHLLQEDPVALSVIGEHVGRTKQRVSQIKNKVQKDLRKMSHALA